jgi:hypothetical protein
MKNISSFLKGLIICGVALAMVSTLDAQTATQGKAKVIKIKGSARYSTGRNDWKPLSVGDVLRPGTLIQTGVDRDSYVDLTFGDGSSSGPIASSSSSSELPTAVSYYQPKAQQNYLRIYQNSLVGIDKLTSMDTGGDVVTETQLDLKAGHIFGGVKKMSALSKYEVKMPNGVAGIRGTVFDITAEGVVKVSSGSVVLAYVGADGTVVTQVVNSAEQFDARTGQLTPIQPATVGAMQVLASEGARVSAVSPSSTIYTVDHTIYRVASPNKHDPDNDGDNDQGHGHGADPDNDPI